MYSLQTTNRFEYLLDDNDEVEHDENVNTAKPANQNKDVKKDGSKKETSVKKSSTKSVAQTKAAPIVAEKTQANNNRNENKPMNKPQIGFGNFNQSDDKVSGPRNAAGGDNRPPRARPPPGTFNKGPALSNVGNRQPGSGFGSGGGGGFGGNDNRGKREYDRKSGSEKSGVKATDKREGSGPHNWGNSIKDFSNETFAPPADEGEEEHKASADEKKEGEEGGDAPAVAAPEEPSFMSLEQYLESKKQSKPEVNVQLRKAGEGDGSFSAGKLGKKLPLHEKNKEEETVTIVSGKSGRVKNKMHLEFAPSGQRGGRGGGRGRGGARGNQGHFGGHGHREEPIVMDESAFPALGPQGAPKVH